MNDFFKDKKVFITGNTGFKGSYLCEMLLMQNADIMGFSKDKSKLYELLDLDNRMTTVYGDIRDYKTLERTINNFNPDIIIHMCAQPLVRESYIDPRNTFEINMMGTVNILDIAIKNNNVKSLLNVTTDKVYLNREWEYGYRENDELCGMDPYSNSKSCSELITISYQNSFNRNDLSISTARSGNVIGGGDFAKDRIIPDCMRAYLNNEDIIVRNPYSVRPYQHVLDTLNGYLMLVSKQYNNKKYEGSYNFGPSVKDCLETGELVTLFCDKMDNKIEWLNISDNGPHEANFLRLDTSKSKMVLKWYPVWNIEKSIEKTTDFIKCYQENKDIRKLIDLQIKEFYNDIYNMGENNEKRRVKRKNI